MSYTGGMMYNVLVILLFSSPFLLLATYLLTAKSKSFWKIFTAHTIALIIYMTFVVKYSKLLLVHDEYGLGQLGLGILFIIGHIIIGFTHGLYITLNNFTSKRHKWK
jgi:predicted permease